MDRNFAQLIFAPNEFVFSSAKNVGIIFILFIVSSNETSSLKI